MKNKKKFKNIKQDSSKIMSSKLLAINKIEVELCKIADNYVNDLNRQDNEVLGEMYEPMVDLANLLINSSKFVNDKNRDLIAHELAVDVIMRFKHNQDFFVYAWNKYLRLALLRVNTKYVVRDEQKFSSKLIHTTESEFTYGQIENTLDYSTTLDCDVYYNDELEIEWMRTLNKLYDNSYDGIIKKYKALTTNSYFKEEFLREIANETKRVGKVEPTLCSGKVELYKN